MIKNKNFDVRKTPINKELLLRLKQVFLNISIKYHNCLYIAKYSDGDIVFGINMYSNEKRYYGDITLYLKSLNRFKSSIVSDYFDDIEFDITESIEMYSFKKDNGYLIESQGDYSSILTKATSKDIMDVYKHFYNIFDYGYFYLMKQMDDNETKNHILNLSNKFNELLKDYIVELEEKFI